MRAVFFLTAWCCASFFNDSCTFLKKMSSLYTFLYKNENNIFVYFLQKDNDGSAENSDVNSPYEPTVNHSNTTVSILCT